MGFKYRIWAATDGERLYDEPLSKKIALLEKYEDPYYKRPMKTGEVSIL